MGLVFIALVIAAVAVAAGFKKLNEDRNAEKGGLSLTGKKAAWNAIRANVVMTRDKGIPGDGFSAV